MFNLSIVPSAEIEEPLYEPATLVLPGSLSIRTRGTIVAALSTLVYTLLYWNSFLSASCAATFLYPAELLLEGKIPYRDFFFIPPPLTLFKTALLIQLFGHKVAVLRIEAIVERVVLSGVVYWWLARYFRAAACLLGTIVAFVVFASDQADALVSNHHDSVFWAVLAGFFAAKFIRAQGKQTGVPALLAGIFAGLCFLTKQTTGGAITVCIPVVIAALETRNRRRIWQFCLRFVAGWLVPCGLVAGWLIHEGALPAFVTCVFLSGSAKGSAVTVFLRPFADRWMLVTSVTLLLLFGGWLLRRAGKSFRAESPVMILGVFTGVILILAAAWHVAATRPTTLLWAQMIRMPLLPATLVGSLLLLARHSLPALRKDASSLSREFVVLSSIAAATAYALSMSFAYYGPMAVPGLALVIAFAVDRSGPGLPRFLVWASLCAVAVFFQAEEKLQVPYNWMDWPEGNVAAARYHSKFAQLDGLSLSESTGAIVDRVGDAIMASSAPNDSMLVYPYLPIFYSLTGLRHATYSYSHYSDVAPDAICERDARALRQNPPAVIVRMLRPEASLRADERLFRGDRSSGVRSIEAALDDLAPAYQVVETAEVPVTGVKLQVLIRRPDRPITLANTQP